MKKVVRIYLIIGLVSFCQVVHLSAQVSNGGLWHDKERSIRYRPEGTDFVIENGERRFNRALYGTSTGFRVEAGDLPEFALYMPGMGGNLQLGLISGDTSKWLIAAQDIKAIYRPGSMHYEIKDDWLGKGTLYLQLLAASDREGILINLRLENTGGRPPTLLFAFGGATGKRFNRDGDIGADPESSFYLKPEYCKDNRYELNENYFTLHYGPTDKDKQKKITGTLPPGSTIKLSDASAQSSPLTFLKSNSSGAVAMSGKVMLKEKQETYLAIQNPRSGQPIPYDSIPLLFKQAEAARAQLSGRVRLHTPDPYLNTLGGALSIAGDAIWEDPSYLHGAVAWRMRLNAWRGAYIADPLGWHDRAKKHFSSYALSQLTSPEKGPLVPDTALHFARQTERLGTTLFSSGYICRNPGGDFRPHHYDMNLVFIDQLLTHLQWTGDLTYARELWPVIQRHLAWEKRNFDGDGDGLYDAYCCIWASDALQYSNGGVTHSSSYNYRANRMAARLAALIGENPASYEKEAARISQAIHDHLWLRDKGWYAEYKDFSGNKLTHPAAGLWTIYHAIDSDVPDLFQAYQSLRYVDTQIPHIPVRARGLPDQLYTVSTTNWLPYTWSINNVALAEVLHTSLAYWKGGNPREAFTLWKSALLESMYLSASPGGFEQLSFYDAMRGELYRDFADPIGMAGRSLVEGLFGIRPDALKDTLSITPGFPLEWDHASLTIPDLSFEFKRKANQDQYLFTPSFAKPMNLKLQVRARAQNIKSVVVNGKKATWKVVPNALELPAIEITSAKAKTYTIIIVWQGEAAEQPVFTSEQVSGEPLKLSFKKAVVTDYYDPQQALEACMIHGGEFTGRIKATDGNKTVFIKTRQGQMEWWTPVCFKIISPVQLQSTLTQKENTLQFTVKNNTSEGKGRVTAGSSNKPYVTEVSLAKGESKALTIPEDYLVTGSNPVSVEWNGKASRQSIINWQITMPQHTEWNTLDLTPFYNDQVTRIFKNNYVSPRPPYPTLQIPWQGIGNWCYPLTEASIDDTGLRALAGAANKISLPQGIPFAIPGEIGKPNIAFTSLWNNYPDSLRIPVTGKSSHAYFLMAGSTNHMQSRLMNGVVIVQYQDGSREQLELKNPETWWPIEQDYYTDGYAFRIDYPAPIRLHLKTGRMTTHFSDYQSIKGFSNYAIDGGSATVLDLPLNASKELKSITLKTIANEVVIGLMGVTLLKATK